MEDCIASDSMGSGEWKCENWKLYWSVRETKYVLSNLHNLCSTVIYVSRLGLDNETEKPVSRLASGPVLLYYEFCEQKKWRV